MATSTETSVDLAVNDVASDSILYEMESQGLLQPHNIFVTPDEDEGEGSGGTGQIILRRWTD